MDYLTKSVNRKQLRELSIILRKLFGLDENCKIPVIEMLDRLPYVFKGSYYSVVEDRELPKNVPAACRQISETAFEIRIKNSVYIGAYERDVGGYRAHILHEICHVFLYTLGFKPILQRSFRNGELAPYKSAEWQAKALCGETMMPFKETKHLTTEQIMKIYGVSRAQAEYRKSYN